MNKDLIGQHVMVEWITFLWLIAFCGIWYIGHELERIIIFLFTKESHILPIKYTYFINHLVYYLLSEH